MRPPNRDGKQLDIKFWSSKERSRWKLKLESSALDNIEGMGMIKIPQGDNGEAWEENVGITQDTMAFQVYTADVLLATWSYYLFMSSLACFTSSGTTFLSCPQMFDFSVWLVVSFLVITINWKYCPEGLAFSISLQEPLPISLFPSSILSSPGSEALRELYQSHQYLSIRRSN